MNLRAGISLTLFLFLFSSFARPHAIYVSVIEISHEENADSLSVCFKMFKDDLRDAVRNFNGENHDMDEIESIDYQSDIAAYLENHFTIRINQSDSKLSQFNYEIEAETVWVTGQVKCPSHWHQCKIETSLFTALFPTQSNVIQLINGNEKRFERLNLKQQSVLFQF